MSNNLSFEGNFLTPISINSYDDYSTPIDMNSNQVLALLMGRVEDFAQTEFSSVESERTSPAHTTPAEIKQELLEMASQHKIEIPETELARRAELEKIYDEQIKDQPPVPGKLSTKTLTKEEWVEMRIGLEKKLNEGLLHRVNQAAKIVGKGLAELENRGMKGAILQHPYKMEAVLPQHPMGDTLKLLENEWLTSKDTMNFGDWLQANHPEILIEGVKYFSEEERQLTALSLNDHGVFMNGNTLYSTANERVGAGLDPQTRLIKYKEGFAMYVVGPDQTFHATSQVVFEKHHSSLLAGGAVIGAGECKIENGKLVMISNKSGHYKPSKENMLDVLRVLKAQNVPLSDVRLEITMPDNSKYLYRSAQEFLDKGGVHLPERIISRRSTTTFKESLVDGKKKLTVLFKNGSNAASLKSCAECGWKLSEVEVRDERASGHVLVYSNAERYLEKNEIRLPSSVIYGEGQQLQIITNAQNDKHVKKLIFSPSMTSEQIDDLIAVLRREWIPLEEAEFQIGVEGEVKSIREYEEERAAQIAINDLGIEGEIVDVDDADD